MCVCVTGSLLTCILTCLPALSLETCGSVSLSSLHTHSLLQEPLQNFSRACQSPPRAPNSSSGHQTLPRELPVPQDLVRNLRASNPCLVKFLVIVFRARGVPYNPQSPIESFRMPQSLSKLSQKPPESPQIPPNPMELLKDTKIIKKFRAPV